MALTITHSFVSSKSDGTDPTVVQPSNWNADHIITGTIIEAQLDLSDVTTANVSTSMHGFAPKSPGDATLYLDGTGAYSTPNGGGGSDLLSSDNVWTGNNEFVDVTVQKNIISLSSTILATVGNSPQGIFVLDNCAYVLNGTDSTLSIVDVNLGAIVSSLNLGEGVSPYSIFVNGTIAYITCASASSIIIVDVSITVEPNIIVTLSVPGPTSGVYVSGHIAYVTLASGGLLTIDISNPLSPVAIGGTPVGHQSAGVVVYPVAEGLYAFVADTTDNGVYLVEVSDPTNLFAPDSAISTGNGPMGVDVADRFLYVANSTGNSVSVIYVDSPEEVIVTVSVGNNPQFVQVCGTYLFVTNSTDSTIGVVDITIPAAPVYLGAITLPGPTSGMFVSGRNIYVNLPTLNEIAVVQLPSLNTVGLEANTVDVGNLLVRNQAIFTDDVQIGRGLAVGYPGVWVDGPITSNSNVTVEGNLTVVGSIIGSLAYTNLNVSTSISIGASSTAFPLVVGGISVTSGYGYAQAQIVSDQTETGLQIANTSADGRSYTIISSGTGSDATAGKFIIGDVLAGLPRFSIDQSGNVGIGTTTPTAALDVISTETGTRGFFVSAPSGQTVNIVEVDLNNQWVFYIDQNGTTNTGNISATGSITATTLAGSYQNWESGNSTINFDLSKGNVQTLTLTTNTAPTFTNIVNGQSLTLVFTQDGTGGRIVTWPYTITYSGNLELNLAPYAVTTLNFISTDGSTLTPVTQFGATALPGNPKPSQATGTYAAGFQEITITAISVGAGQNGLVINFDTDATYVETVVREVIGDTPPIIYIGLANTGSGSTATGNDVVEAINSGIASADISATVTSPGTGFVTTGSVTLAGAQNQIFTPVGGELWFDSSALYVGQSDGSFETIAYTS